MDTLKITKLEDDISYIEPTITPLSANVVIIETSDNIWLYDVGNHPDIPELIEKEYYNKDINSDIEINGKINGNINGKINDSINSNINGKINGDINSNINGRINGGINSNINSKINGSINGDINNKVNGKKRNINIILSHFHTDHIGCLNAIIERLGCKNIYQGRYTYKHTNKGLIVEDDIYIEDDNMKLHIFPLPSSHAKGSLGLEINEKYCFIGDGIYAMQKGTKRLYNAGILQDEISVLNGIKADKFMCSHRNPYSSSKTAVIKWLRNIYENRNKENAYIEYADVDTK